MSGNTEKVTECGDKSLPSCCSYFSISWSIMWRYMVFVLALVGVFSIFQFEDHSAMTTHIIAFLKSLEQTVATQGYKAALMAYPMELLIWTMAKFLVGYLVMVRIFKSISCKKYHNFFLCLSLACQDDQKNQCSYRHCVAPMIIAWAFYWRFLVIMVVVFMVSLFFLSPAMMVEHYMRIYMGYLAIAYLVVTYLLKRIVNKPICGVTLSTMTCKK